MKDFELDDFLNQVDMGDDYDLFMDRRDDYEEEEDVIREIDFR